jgi:seryl-tRNA synthetase
LRERELSRCCATRCSPTRGDFLQVIEVDVEWRQLQFKVDNLRADYGKVNKEVAAKKKAKEDADDLIAKAKGIDADIKVKLPHKAHAS